MRIRTLLTLTTGAALGAGAMYLLDPERGPDRRRDARRDAVHTARVGAVQVVREAQRHAGSWAAAAVAGYRDARAGADGDSVALLARRRAG